VSSRQSTSFRKPVALDFRSVVAASNSSSSSSCSGNSVLAAALWASVSRGYTFFRHREEQFSQVRQPLGLINRTRYRQNDDCRANRLQVGRLSPPKFGKVTIKALSGICRLMPVRKLGGVQRLRFSLPVIPADPFYAARFLYRLSCALGSVLNLDVRGSRNSPRLVINTGNRVESIESTQQVLVDRNDGRRLVSTRCSASRPVFWVRYG